MNKEDLAILVNSLPGNETPPEFAIKLLEDTCARTGLDWKMRHLYLMKRGGKWSVTLSIDGFRLIGSQDAEYAGQEGPFWVTTSDGTWTDIPPDGAIYASKVGIKHRNGTVTWGVAKYKDYAAGPMWTKFPSTMVAKCAEMLAWRKAMPGKLGGLYGIEEMAQADKSLQKAMAMEVEPEPREATNNWSIRLLGAKSLDEVKAIGRELREAKLDEKDMLLLHKTFTEMKAKHGG